MNRFHYERRPVSPGDMLEVNRLIHDLKKEENRI